MRRIDGGEFDGWRCSGVISLLYKKTATFLIGILITVTVFAQEKNHIHLKLIQPGIEYQFAINNKLLASVDIGFGLINLGYDSEDEFESYLSSFSNVTVKHVYNSSKVMGRSKKLLSHSGNYYGIRCLAYNKNVSKGSRGESFNCAIGPVWGVQRYHKRFFYQLEFGLGYHSRKEVRGIAPLARCCVGFKLTRQKN